MQVTYQVSTAKCRKVICTHMCAPAHPLSPPVHTFPSSPSTPFTSCLVLASSACSSDSLSLSPSRAAHVMIRSKFLCIYLASKFALLWDFNLYNYYLSNWTAAFIINVIRFITFIRPFMVLSLFNLSLCPTLPTLTCDDLSGSYTLIAPLLSGLLISYSEAILTWG